MRRQVYILLRSGHGSRSRIRLRALSRIRTALAGSRTGWSIVVRAVVFLAVATFGPDPCCQAADGDGRDCDQGHPVAEGALLTGGRGWCVERAARALSSVVGHVHRGLIGGYVRDVMCCCVVSRCDEYATFGTIKGEVASLVAGSRGR